MKALKRQNTQRTEQASDEKRAKTARRAKRERNEPAARSGAGDRPFFPRRPHDLLTLVLRVNYSPLFFLTAACITDTWTFEYRALNSSTHSMDRSSILLKQRERERVKENRRRSTRRTADLRAPTTDVRAPCPSRASRTLNFFQIMDRPDCAPPSLLRLNIRSASISARGFRNGSTSPMQLEFRAKFLS